MAAASSTGSKRSVLSKHRACQQALLYLNTMCTAWQQTTCVYLGPRPAILQLAATSHAASDESPGQQQTVSSTDRFDRTCVVTLQTTQRATGPGTIGCLQCHAAPLLNQWKQESLPPTAQARHTFSMPRCSRGVLTLAACPTPHRLWVTAESP